jgi:hypothetical protein
MTELLLVIVAVAVATIVVYLAMSLALAGLRLTAAYFVLPQEPSSLTRLRKILELQVVEDQAAEAAARHRYPPPPEIVTVVRAIAGTGGYPARRGSSWRTRGLGE